MSLAPGLPGWLLEAAAAPWAALPAGKKSSQVVMVVWQYGKIYEKIVFRFQADWGSQSLLTGAS